MNEHVFGLRFLVRSLFCCVFFSFGSLLASSNSDIDLDAFFNESMVESVKPVAPVMSATQTPVSDSIQVVVPGTDGSLGDTQKDASVTSASTITDPAVVAPNNVSVGNAVQEVAAEKDSMPLATGVSVVSAVPAVSTEAGQSIQQNSAEVVIGKSDEMAEAPETAVWPEVKSTSGSDFQADVSDESSDQIINYARLDSVEDGPGNWFFKSQIMKKARSKVSEIRTVLKRIQSMQEPQQKTFDGFDVKFDLFYRDCGFQKGEIQNELSSIEAELVAFKDANIGISVSAAVAESVKILEEKRDALKEEQAAYEEVLSLDAMVRELVGIFGKQLVRASEYLDVALERYEEIENTLNDETAEYALNAIEASYANILNIEQYLLQDFSQFVSRLSTRIDEAMKATTAGITKLRDMGVELNKVLREEKALLEKQQQEELARKRALALQQQEEAKFFNRVKRWMFGAWDWVKEKALWVKSFFATQAEAPVQKVE